MRRILLVLASAAAILTFAAGPAAADAPVGNSGHSNNGSHQCQSGGNDHCPPFGK